MGRSATNGPEIYNDSASPTISHSLIAGGVGSIPGAIDGGSNLSDDPLFRDAASGDLRLQYGSPAIDAGDNSAPGLSGILTDLDGSPRFVDGSGDGTATVDMGAYENQTVCPATTTLFVNQAATGSGSGSDWANAQPDLAVALDRAAVCNVAEVWVAAGIYVPGAAESDSFNLVPGVAVYGGFDGTETAREERDWAANLTVLSGDIGDDDANKVNGVVTDTADIVGGNSDHVIVADGASGTATTILDGFTITAGQADDDWGRDSYGGGFYCNGRWSSSECSPSLSNVSFSGNTAYMGGAMCNYSDEYGSSSPSLTNVSFSGNTATGSGGAMANEGDYGGSSSPSLTNVSFTGNSAANSGGAMYNDSDEDGSECSPSLTNVSFSGNSAANSGGAMYNNSRNSGSSSPILTNVILWGDSASSGPEIYNDDAGTTISNSLIAGGVGSPAVDAGDNSAPGLTGILSDLDGNPRVVDGDGDETATVDMGAYESQTQAIALTGGWNLISLYRQPDDPAPAAVLAGIETEVVLLKNGQGEVYWPTYGIDQIGSWVLTDGYQIYLSAPATLSVSGALVDPAQMPVALGAGWNMAAYVRDSSMAIDTALDGISDELLLVKNGDGLVYWPDMGINEIGSMAPGQGYQMYMYGEATLTYPGN